MSASAGVEVKRETNLAALADKFLASKVDRAPRTYDTYRQTIEHHIRPKIGNLAVSEATTERLGRFIQTVVTDHGPGAAKACRSVLSGMMGMAARSDAIRVNPVREISNIEARAEGAIPIPLADLPGLLVSVREDARLRELDVADLIEFLAGTGCRVSEACGLAWEDVDLAEGSVTIKANAVRARGLGVLRQDHTKTKAGIRTITPPATLVSLLTDRRVNATTELVFPTILGNLRDPRNTSRDWSEARTRLGFPGVTTHSFRKTVATALDRAGLSAREIADYLGHENPSLTQDVYMARNTGGAKAAKALEPLVG
ncbi:tyrosine-type recombinase/integrase [Salinibacterium sp. G-O1]|uniref:site-specific integrase n=1 Tax=Salinibacterium sp. G-O1 TaxID=3046208 RepID=UPI0024BBE919|nr:site-specific integrase [Salinibacterium sp. G-O1]MDJ0336423.1 tyrosine-type recombinase/integrase [Salinibacterium sp. G-O1]